MRPIYLDNNATTRTDPAVVAAMLPYFSEQFGNASSAHAFGSEVAGAVKQARKGLQALLGSAFDHEIVFTSGGTESNNAAILSALETQDGRDEIVTTAVEHPAVLSLVEHLAASRGIKTHFIGVDAQGRLDLGAFRSALGPRTAIASVMWANNETGTLFPVTQLAAMAHEAGALFHTDAVQAVGKIPLDLKATGIDMLSLSGHKLHGPKGIGALYLRKGTKFSPLVRGGPQERRRRGGTENVPGIVGLGKAAELALAQLQDEEGRVRALRDRLERGILQIGDCIVLGDAENRLPNTSNIAFEHLEGEAIIHHLNRAGIAASLGSACASGSMEPSHVLRAMNVPLAALRGAVRFSLSRDNTIDDVVCVLNLLPEIVAKLRASSPLWQERGHITANPSRSTELTL
ncbi:cysteine desulfurase NifS [Bradyrhizobium sp. AUGA SZCCT0283]|uniref:cysteine desulfurase NifS n=1 Tax=Bradyrhizobium sp. AUGA SZCCT0283 TaxID=2807671 RepID=UPI001BA64BE9|nr:cysteine desulfurase NifS [Bradyrhizobium sp. AUGA SZCCT0283]MBR1279391.1 cysteine desulfurase NifS [Bradyrhizobium sp. AUGA SZCCT0283]